MENPRHNILSVVFKLLIFLGLILLVTSLSKFYSYFNTGAEFSTLSNQTYIKKAVHHPEMDWNFASAKEGVQLDAYTQDAIEKAYVSAWYLLNKSISNNKNMGLEDHFSPQMIEKILNRINTNGTTIEDRVDLTHHLDLHLFSYDRQLVSFSDNYVKIIKRIRNTETGSEVAIKDTCHYDVLMALEDGYWQVKELVQVNSPSFITTHAYNGGDMEKFNADFICNAVNYYPSKTPWFAFWDAFASNTIDRDLQIASAHGFNAIRIFIPYEAFGKHALNPDKLSKLDSLLDISEKNNLKVIVTLFDFPESFALSQYPATGQHIKGILQRYKENENILAWDLKNEADLDFEGHGKKEVLDWLAYIINICRKEAPQHQITIGWSKAEYAHLFADDLDIVSFHSYRSINVERESILDLKKKIASRNLMISEFGKTSYRSTLLPFGSTENEQAVYTQDMIELMEKEGIPHFAFWTLFDFEEAPKEVFGWKPWIKKSQEKMGLIDVHGESKRVSKIFNQITDTPIKKSISDYIKPFYLIVLFSLTLFFIFFRFLYRRYF